MGGYGKTKAPCLNIPANPDVVYRKGDPCISFGLSEYMIFPVSLQYHVIGEDCSKPHSGLLSCLGTVIVSVSCGQGLSDESEEIPGIIIIPYPG